MKKQFTVLKTTLLGGMLFLVPFILLVFIVGKALDLIRSVVLPIATRIPIKSIIGLENPKILAVFILLILCFFAGLIAKTALAKKLVNRLELMLFSRIPGYSFMKNLGVEVAGGSPSEDYQSVLVCLGDYYQIGFLVEHLPESRVVVFIPDSPSPWSGGVFILDESRVSLVDESSMAAITCLQKLGAGAGNLIAGKFNPRVDQKY